MSLKSAFDDEGIVPEGTTMLPEELRAVGYITQTGIAACLEPVPINTLGVSGPLTLDKARSPVPGWEHSKCVQ